MLWSRVQFLVSAIRRISMKEAYEFPDSFYVDEEDMDMFDDEQCILNDTAYLGPSDFGDSD